MPDSSPECPLSPDERADLASLEEKVNALLPSQYHFCSDAASPTSMGSAGLKYRPDGHVAWEEIWTSFCDLAMAGGPPHRGSLLEAPTPQEVEEEPAGYQLVLEEILRGVRLTTRLETSPGSEPGWVSVRCHDEAMAGWLLRAVLAENVFIRQWDDTVEVPAGPWFRLAKEVKNVIVALAKTCHYWRDHLSGSQRAAAARLMTGSSSALLQPASRAEVLARRSAYGEWMQGMMRAVQVAIGQTTLESLGWVGVRYVDERTAAWFTRAAIAENVLARREAEVLYLPVPAAEGERVEAVERLARLHRLWGMTFRGSA